MGRDLDLNTDPRHEAREARGAALEAQWAIEDEAEAIVEDEAVRQFVLRRFSHNRPAAT